MVHLNCRHCGARIDLPDGADWFVCAACGTEYTVERARGALLFRPASRSVEPEQGAAESCQSASADRMERLDADLAVLEQRMGIGAIIAVVGTLIVVVALFLSESGGMSVFPLALLVTGAIVTFAGGAIWVGTRDPIYLKRREMRRLRETISAARPDEPGPGSEGETPG